MASINVDQILEYNSDTLPFLRKQYNLYKPDRLEEAIAILQDWLSKQAHIVRKNYSKDYLERTIILSKGSVERAKMKLDKIATYRTLLPHFFEPIPNAAKLPVLDLIPIGFLPKMTKDHYRVFWVKNNANKYDSSDISEFYRILVMLCEYLQSHDYCNGILTVFDYRGTNIFEMVKCLNVTEMHQILKIIMDGFGMRIKGIHFISTSKAIETFITLFKQVLSAKVAERIQVHQNIDSLYDYIPKEIMPRDYGGQEKTVSELSRDMSAVLSTENNLKYFKEMQCACTNENYRREDKFNDQYMGTPGSFRKLAVD
ncbi:alpha-tocopherol transfer protein-like [Pararge aegeria]|uniref:alpha-tocopherol transfer protein-like n=1 Tax=Pararge aegeria TaxID=116150 RepID=UPI0019D30322|nr:alpha-tocopherol transfer protein-like [Pararge aegeria]